MMKYFTKDLEDLIEGIPFWCEALKKEVTVFGVFHGFEGDLPGKAQASGFKRPGNSFF